MARSSPIYRTWEWEIAAIVFAVGLIVAISVILASYNGRPLPHWGNHLNLNALLALLSTILRAMLVIIVAQVISQRKWFGEKRERSLSDLQRFDYGSRSSYGALYLIPIVRKDAVTLTAAIVLVSSFLVGPFVQQASGTKECSFPASGPNATLPSAHFIPRQSDYSMFAGVLAIVSSITAPSGIENQINATCTTGNCTFPYGDPTDTYNGSFSNNDLTTHSSVAMCSKCTNITSLINSTCSNSIPLCTYTLPNGFNLTVNITEPDIEHPITYPSAIIRTTADLNWLGDLQTMDVRTTSRWAYVNVTFFAVGSIRAWQDDTVIDESNRQGDSLAGVESDGQGDSLAGVESDIIASTCSLYPCLRTYTASVTNNKLIEKQVSSEVMKIGWSSPLPVGNDPEKMQGQNSMDEIEGFYTAVKSPCRVDGLIYNKSHDQIPYDTRTQLTLSDFTDRGGPSPYQYSAQTTTAPEQCIYRYEPGFVSNIANLLHTNVFNGDCTDPEELHCQKFITSHYDAVGDLGNLGVGSTLYALSNYDRLDFLKITAWFDGFADAMTNRLRLEYGGQNPYGDDVNISSSYWQLDPGIVHGLVWQTRTCVDMRIAWLSLPACLTLVTAVLAIWTIIKSWKERHQRPVWKDSILPLFFYSHMIQSRVALGQLSNDDDDDENINYIERLKETTHLMEIDEITTRSRGLVVRFREQDIIERTATRNESSSSITERDV